MPVRLNSSGGGSVTVDVPSTASNFTHTLPAVTGTVVTTGSTAVVTPAMLSTGAPAWDGSGNLQFNSGFGSAAIAYGCRAWVSFNGTGTVAIRSSGNVSSITDNSTGDYTVNFTNAMPDANYAYSHSFSNEVSVQHTVGFLETLSSSALRIRHYNAGNSANAADKLFVFIAVFR
jgi:hypothetical protein